MCFFEEWEAQWLLINKYYRGHFFVNVEKSLLYTLPVLTCYLNYFPGSHTPAFTSLKLKFNAYNIFEF